MKESIGLRPCFQLFVCKGLLPLFSAVGLRITAALAIICLQRTATLICCYSFTKDCSPCLPVSFSKDCCPYFCFCLQRIVVLIFCYLFAKDCCPCLMLFICKGLRSLSYAIHLQRTASPRFLQSICKELWSLFPAIHLQRTAVLDFCYSFTKDCGPCLPISIEKNLLFLIVLFCLLLCICKGLRPCSTLSLQRTVVLVFCYLHAKDCCPFLFFLFFAFCLQRIVVHVFCLFLQLIAVVVSC